VAGKSYLLQCHGLFEFFNVTDNQGLRVILAPDAAEALVSGGLQYTSVPSDGETIHEWQTLSFDEFGLNSLIRGESGGGTQDLYILMTATVVCLQNVSLQILFQNQGGNTITANSCLLSLTAVSSPVVVPVTAVP